MRTGENNRDAAASGADGQRVSFSGWRIEFSGCHIKIGGHFFEWESPLWKQASNQGNTGGKARWESGVRRDLCGFQEKVLA
jgi:hypothetical protein